LVIGFAITFEKNSIFPASKTHPLFMKQCCIIIFTFYLGFLNAQTIDTYEKPPIFPGCEGQPIEALKVCFNNKLNQHIFNNFEVPQIVNDESYSGDIKILFEVDKEGQINVLFIDAVYNELKDETRRVFEDLSKITPGTYNGRPTYFQYSLSVKIPLVDPEVLTNEVKPLPNVKEVVNLNDLVSNEFDSVNLSTTKYKKLEYQSQLNIPFTHNYYAKFDQQMNGLGTNSHTGAKPFMYSDVAKYYDFKAEKEALIKGTDAWWSKKLYDEHFVAVQGKDYWFTVDPVFDLQVGKDTEADFNSTFNNTRGIYLQGGLGKKLNFTASVYESQGRFAQYFNEYAESLKASGSDPAIVPGRGIAKRFKEDAYDYPVAEAYLSYTPSDFLNIQFGHG